MYIDCRICSSFQPSTKAPQEGLWTSSLCGGRLWRKTLDAARVGGPFAQFLFSLSQLCSPAGVFTWWHLEAKDVLPPGAELRKLLIDDLSKVGGGTPRYIGSFVDKNHDKTLGQLSEQHAVTPLDQRLPGISWKECAITFEAWLHERRADGSNVLILASVQRQARNNTGT